MSKLKRQGKYLEFINQISPDGKKLRPVSEAHAGFQATDSFELVALSLTNHTYIAHGSSLTYIVKLKHDTPVRDCPCEDECWGCAHKDSKCKKLKGWNK